MGGGVKKQHDQRPEPCFGKSNGVHDDCDNSQWNIDSSAQEQRKQFIGKEKLYKNGRSVMWKNRSKRVVTVCLFSLYISAFSAVLLSRCRCLQLLMDTSARS